MSTKRKVIVGDEDESSTKRHRAEEVRSVTPRIEDDDAKPRTVFELYELQKRTPPKGSENVPMSNEFLTGPLARELLGCTFEECNDVEKQLRYAFIVLKDYKGILETKLMKAFSPYEDIFRYEKGFKSPVDALRKSLRNDTECGIRLGRLIQLGGDVVTETCQRSQLRPCIETYDEFLEKNPAWQNSETGVFRRRGDGDARVEPFLRLQTKKKSNLCYLIQSSNGINYHLQMRVLEGDKDIRPFRLNNPHAGYMRNFFTAEASCMHIFAGRGNSVATVLLDILRRYNPDVSNNDLLREVNFSKGKRESAQDAAAATYSSLKRFLNRCGPGFFDMPTFKEFAKAAKHAGDFSTKSSTKGKHTLLLVDIRKSEVMDASDGGGYFALFQNTWENREIWVEMGFDLLLSMEGNCYFIADELKFNGEVDAADERDWVLAQSSSPPPIADYSRYANDKPFLQLHGCAGTEEEEEEEADESSSNDPGSEAKTEASVDVYLRDCIEVFIPKPNTFYLEE